MVEPSDELHLVFNKAVENAKKLKHEYVTTEHFAHAMLCTESLPALLANLNIDTEALKKQLNDYLLTSCDDMVLDADRVVPVKTKTVERVLNRAFTQVLFIGKAYIDLPDILLSMLSENQTYSCYCFNKAGIFKDKFVEFLHEEYSQYMDEDYDEDDDDDAVVPTEKQMENADRILNHFTRNLNEEALDDKIDPVIGRETELEQIMLAMGRRSKNNAILVGHEGTGKTAIAEGLAWNIVHDRVPEFLDNAVIYSLDIGTMLAGAKYRGDFEERFKLIMKALSMHEDSILFIDEAHMINGAGAGGRDSSNDLANLLKPALARGNIRVIASTTWDEYRKHFEKDRALMRRFQRVTVDEPDRDTAVDILMGSKRYYEEYHNASIVKSAIASAVDLSIKYMPNNKLPDKAFDLIDQACARFNLVPVQKRIVRTEQIQYELSKLTNLPLSKISEKETDNLINLENNLKSFIYGQDSAIETIVNKVVVSQAGLKSDNKPVGSFVFRGSTGTGKSYTAIQLAQHMGVPFVRIDMSEYQEKHSVAKLLGSPPGYVGYEENNGLLITKLQENPGCVLLLDEIEKAHPDVSQVLLQMMDNGKVTGSNGKIADVTNSIIILTTNLDAYESDKNSIGFSTSLEKEYGDAEFKQFFSPEFRNRLDAVITFNRLDKGTMMKIVGRMLADLKVIVKKKRVYLELSDEAIDRLVELGFDPKMGARPLERAIDKHVKQPLSRMMLFGELKNGGNAIIDCIDNNITVYKKVAKKLAKATENS